MLMVIITAIAPGQGYLHPGKCFIYLSVSCTQNSAR